MIRHIALFKLKESANGQTKAENLAQIKRNVERLRESIGTIKTIEARENLADANSPFPAEDLCVYVEFANQADYDFYFNHPVHKEAAAFAGAVTFPHGITIAD
jgi:hypothetical protein